MFPSSTLAADYALAGENDKAFAWLDKAYDEREGQSLTLLKVDPSFKNLRSDPAILRLAAEDRITAITVQKPSLEAALRQNKLRTACHTDLDASGD